MSNNHSARYAVLDSIRGFTVLNMIIYHAIWDLVYIYGVNWNWFFSRYAGIWQQAICITFIFLSGFCWSFSRHNLKRGLIVFLSGALVTYVTSVFIPQNRIMFGVLTLIGSSMLLMIIIDKLIKNKRPLIRFIVCILLFIATKNVTNGYLGLGKLGILTLPESWYASYFSTFLGFKAPWFSSSDYFPLIPWFFMFIAGYFMHKVFGKNKLFKYLKKRNTNFLDRIGRHSLIIYLLHQPVIYAVCLLLDKFSII